MIHFEIVLFVLIVYRNMDFMAHYLTGLIVKA